ncbi:MAG: hypothetical protein GX154_11890 [Clostridiales bacterium]|nr:hypothetical protein [Clostridiales bacterium]
MDQERIIHKEDFTLSSEGEAVIVTIDRCKCSYLEYCQTAKENNLPAKCCRMLGHRWLVSNYTGCNYQLKMEYSEDSNYCQGSIYPGEKINQILTKDGDKITIAGERALVLSTNAFGLLMKTIYEYAPHLLEHVLFESTYYSSVVEYDNIKDYFADTFELINYLLKTSNRLGNMRYEIIEYDPLQKTALIRGRGSYMAEIFKNNHLFVSPKASCASARGRLSAYFTKAWGEDIVCEEMKCNAFGDDYCEFILLPKRI